jgi:pimeloyl-ACP methyl ester carboxylesterase
LYGDAKGKNAMRARKIGGFVLRLVLVLLVVGLGAGLLYLRPLPAAAVALDALASDRAVQVTTTADLITFMPSRLPSVGLVFYPGALVDPRAYAVIMHDLATRGIATFIIKLPLDIAFFAPDGASGVIVAHPEIHTWAVAGHSLGGVVACSYAAAHPDRVRGLLLYASYPASDLSGPLASTAILSIFGTNDGLATTAKVAQGRPNLPATTRYTPIGGGIHAYFGDYGAQPGDGTPSISHENAREQIVTASAAFLTALAAP